MRKLIHLTALATPSIRTASYDGESHLVVPVVALVGGVVVRPLGSDGPEYVPSDIISRVPSAWDDRPVFLNHPENGSIPGTDPSTLESQSYGRMFNTHFSNNALQTEVYLSDRRAAVVGQDAVQVLRDLRAGVMREISVGAYVDYEKVEGTSPETGEPYSYRWRQVVPLHLAVGLPGAEGACSLKDGCGALRTALKAAVKNITDKSNDQSEPQGTQPMTLKDLLKNFTSRRSTDDDQPTGAQGLTMEGLWNALAQALYASVPAFAYIEDVEIDSKNVIYSVEPPNSPPVTYRRGYKIRKGNVTLTDDEPQQVTKSQPEWVPVAAQGTNENDNDSNDDASADCGCNKPQPSAAVTAKTKGDDTTMPNHRLSDDARARIIAALIAHDSTPFQDNEDDKKFLNEWPCDRLETYQKGLGKVKAASDDTDDSGKDKDSDVSSPPMSSDEWWKNAPAEIRSMATHYQAQERQERESLIATLSGAQKTYTKEALEKMETAALRELSALRRELKGEDQNVPAPSTFPAVNYGLLPATPPVTTAQYDSSPPDPFAKSNTN